MGFARRYGSLESVRSEISETVPMYKELSGCGAEAWVKRANNRAVFSFMPVSPSLYDTALEEYPLMAVMGSLRYHVGSGTRTSRSERIAKLGICEEVHVFPNDGVKLGVKDGEAVRVVSRQGEVTRKVRLEKALSAGLVFLPGALHGSDTRNLIPLSPIERANWPGWNTCPVRLEKV